MFPLVSGVAAAQGGAALSISFNVAGLNPINLIGPNGAFPITSDAEQITVIASGAGGGRGRN